MRWRRVYAFVALLATVGGSSAACNALLGTPDPVLRDGGTTSDHDGGTTSDHDGGTTSDHDGGTTSGHDGGTTSDHDGGTTSDHDDGATSDAAPLDAPVADAPPPDVWTGPAPSHDSGVPEAGSGFCCGDGGCVPINTTANCGSCGHDCLGGKCTGGVCTPSLLVGSQAVYHGLKSLYGLALVGQTLYGTDWYSSRAVLYSASTTTYAPDPTVFFPSTADAGNAAANVMVSEGDELYFAIFRDDNGWAGGVYSSDLQGTVGQITALQGVLSIAVDPTYLYWATANTITRSTTAGTDQTTYSSVGTLVGFIQAVGGRLYYASETLGLVATQPLDLNTVLVAYSGGTQANAFAVGPSQIVWVDLTAKKVYAASLVAPTAPQDITPAGISLLGLYPQMMTDGKYFYLFDSNINPPGAGATIYRFLPDGTGLQIMATLTDGIFGIAQDSTALYFTTYGNDDQDAGPYSAVWKLAK